MSRRKLPRSYARRAPTREPYDRVLIVCEGEKTEPEYFRGLCRRHQLSNANIKITPAGSSDPIRIVEFAEREMAQDDYDRIYCVFDRDGHATYDRALQRIANSEAGRTNKLKAIISWPCFEFWILLHFRYTAAGFTASGGRSPCDNIIKEIQIHYAGYTKGGTTVYNDLESRIESAITHSIRLQNHNQETSTRNPSTLMHELVDYRYYVSNTTCLPFTKRRHFPILAAWLSKHSHNAATA